MKPPFFSIIIPAFNVSAFIEETLESVFGQTFHDFEIILINDGSTDDTLKKASFFNDKRLRIISTSNNGVAAARNRGIEAAKGIYIAFLDGDDVWHESRLQNAAMALKEHPHISWYSSKSIISANVPQKWLISENKAQVCLYYSHAFIHVNSSSAIIKKSCIPSNLFPNGMVNAEDWVAWSRIANNNSYILLGDTEDVLYRHRNDSASKQGVDRELLKYMELLHHLISENNNTKVTIDYDYYCRYRATQRWLLAISRRNIKCWLREFNTFRPITPPFTRFLVRAYIESNNLLVRFFAKILSMIDNYATRKAERLLSQENK